MDPDSQEPQSKRQKRASASFPERTTIKNPDWSYAHLKMIYDPPYQHSTISPSFPPDILTWRTTLMSALSQFLGITGSAIQVDILHLERDEAWMRIPRRDMVKFTTATSGFVGVSEDKSVGFKTLGSGEFLMGLVGKDTEDDVWS